MATALVALLVATFGAIGLTGWGGYRYQVEVSVPGLSLHLGFQPSWGVAQGGEVCDKVHLNDPSPGCYNIVLFQGEPRQNGDVLLQGCSGNGSAHHKSSEYSVPCVPVAFFGSN